MKRLLVFIMIGVLAVSMCSFAAFAAPEGETAESESPAGESPEGESSKKPDKKVEYTKVKVFEGTYGFGDTEVTVYTNDGETVFDMVFESSFDSEELKGTVEDGIVTVEYDMSGFMASSAQELWDDALASENEWEKVETAAVTSSGTISPAFAEETAEGEFVNDILQTIDDTNKDDAYYEKCLEVCLYNSRVIKAYPLTFEPESYSTYTKAVNKAIKVETIDEEARELLDAAIEAQKALIQIEPTDAHRIYLWGEDMACTQDPETLVYDKDSFDNPDFKPFMVPYILEDQTDCKGNIILVSGGGFTHRANESEGYVIAPLFNEKGYNVFVLQRRVAPYEPKNIY